MRVLRVIDCRIRAGQMSEFVQAVQHWETAVTARSDAPEYHAVMLDQADPAHCLVITRFTSTEDAESFGRSGLMEQFLRDTLSCVDGEASVHSYDLFYAGGPGGPGSVFGESPHIG